MFRRPDMKKRVSKNGHSLFVKGGVIYYESFISLLFSIACFKKIDITILRFMS